MNEQRLMQTLMELCRIPSPSGQEGRVAAYIRRRMAALGLDVEEDGAGQALGSDTGNLLVRVPGRGEPLCLSAHMDTVPVPAGLEEIPLILEGDRLHTGGASILGYDDKGGLAVMLEMAEIAAERKGETRALELLFTIQEERGLRGSGAFDVSRLRARSGFVLDHGSAVGSAVTAQPTKANFMIEVRGKAAHAASNPEKGINAIKALGAIIAGLPTGKLDEETVMNLAKVEGGGAVNVVPDRALLTGEMRSLDEVKLKALDERVRRIAEETAAQFGASAVYSSETLYTLYRISPDTESMRLFNAACQAEGLQPSFEQTLGGSDANNLNRQGMACLVLGLEMENIHSAAESMRPSRFIQAARLLERVICAPAG